MAVFGLYGTATSKWELSTKVEESGAFDAFWDSIAFITNAIVFFYSGVACINFFVRCVGPPKREELFHTFQLFSSGCFKVFSPAIWSQAETTDNERLVTIA